MAEFVFRDFDLTINGAAATFPARPDPQNVKRYLLDVAVELDEAGNISGIFDAWASDDRVTKYETHGSETVPRPKRGNLITGVVDESGPPADLMQARLRQMRAAHARAPRTIPSPALQPKAESSTAPDKNRLPIRVQDIYELRKRGIL